MDSEDGQSSRCGTGASGSMLPAGKTWLGYLEEHRLKVLPRIGKAAR